MQKPITPRIHGVLDYTTAAATAAAPLLFDFPPAAARLCYGLAAGYTGLSLVTAYPLGAKRAVPFPAHGAAEGVIGLVLPFLPRALGFQRHRPARNLMFGLTALTAVVASLTQWRPARADEQAGLDGSGAPGAGVPARPAPAAAGRAFG